jgi:CheY-like chemotaxis protein
VQTGAAHGACFPWVVISSIQRPRVLVVDDDADLRDMLAEFLSDEGFGIDLAVDGLDALWMIDQDAYLDAVVCDLDMPRLDGGGLLRALRRRRRRLAIVILSARLDLLGTAVDLGQVYALAKPVDGPRLVQTLRQAMEVRG